MSKVLETACFIIACGLFYISSHDAIVDINKQIENVSSKCDIILYNITKIDKCEICDTIYDIKLELYMKKYNKTIYFQENVDHINLDKYKDSCYFVKNSTDEVLNFERYIMCPNTVLRFYFCCMVLMTTIYCVLITNKNIIDAYIILFFSLTLFFGQFYVLNIYKGKYDLLIFFTILFLILTVLLIATRISIPHEIR